jgi:hypothetical protein
MRKQILKRNDVLEWTGLTEQQWRKIKKLLKPVKIKGYKIDHWRATDIAKILHLETTL